MSTEELLRAADTTSSVETGGVSNAMDADDHPSFLRLGASLCMRKLLFWIVYLLSVLWIVFAYTLWAFINSAICGRRDHCGRRGNKSFLLRLINYDAMMLTLLASATGAAGAVLCIETKGNPRHGWPIFDKFCRHMWASFGLSIFACFLFIWVIVASARAIRTV
ncbi:hypothetical protein MKX01_014544 [Papaver californicum]|nr:hypothetical protein MKX01_014544 [Papaver californicum]